MTPPGERIIDESGLDSLMRKEQTVLNGTYLERADPNEADSPSFESALVTWLTSDSTCDEILTELAVRAGGERGFTTEHMNLARWDLKAELKAAIERFTDKHPEALSLGAEKERERILDQLAKKLAPETYRENWIPATNVGQKDPPRWEDLSDEERESLIKQERDYLEGELDS